MRSRAHGASPQAISQLPAKKWGFLGMLVYARGDLLAENRAM